MRGPRWFTLALAVALAGLLALVGLPLASLLLRVRVSELVARLQQPVVLDALRLSLVTSTVATALVVALGLPIAYLLALPSFRGKAALETVVQLPMVLPPTVAGFLLLLAFGRQGTAGPLLAKLGLALPFTTPAVVVAQAFMSAPFFISAAAAGLRAVERRYLDAAATLRAPPGRIFWRVMLPLSLPALAAGAVMSWARALGEFGATITFAGNLPGVTQTMPLAVYLALQSDLDAALALSLILVLVSLGVLVLLRTARLGRVVLPPPPPPPAPSRALSDAP